VSPLVAQLPWYGDDKRGYAKNVFSVSTTVPTKTTGCSRTSETVLRQRDPLSYCFYGDYSDQVLAIRKRSRLFRFKRLLRLIINVNPKKGFESTSLSY
jgi:hypothetical protein